MGIFRRAILVSVVMVFASRADAGLILGNLPGQNGSAADLSALTLGVEFTIGATDQTLGSATFEIRQADNALVVAELRAFNSSDATTPGPLLQILNMPSSIGDTPPHPVTFASPAPYTLQAGTSYWVTLTAAPGDFGFNFGGTPAGPGASYVTDYFDDPFFTANAGIPAFALNTQIVPEPSAFHLMTVAGIVGCFVGGVRSRRLA